MKSKMSTDVRFEFCQKAKHAVNTWFDKTNRKDHVRPIHTNNKAFMELNEREKKKQSKANEPREKIF